MSKKKLQESQATSIDRLRRLAGIATTGESDWVGTPSMAVRRQVNAGLVESALKPAFEGPERQAYIKQLLTRVKDSLKRRHIQEKDYVEGYEALSDDAEREFRGYYEMDFSGIQTDYNEDGGDIYIVIPYSISGSRRMREDAFDAMRDDLVGAFNKDVPELTFEDADALSDDLSVNVVRFIIRAP